MADVKKLCRRIIIIDHGRLIYDGQIDALIRRYANYKILSLIFTKPVERKELTSLGEVKNYEEYKAVLSVPRESANTTAAYLLKKFPIEDLNIEEPEIEEIISIVFGNKNK